MDTQVSSTVLDSRVRSRVISAGILTFFAWLGLFGVGHMAVAAIHKMGLDQPGYYIFLLLTAVLLGVSIRTRPAAQALWGGLAGLSLWSAVGEIGQAGELYEDPAIWGVVIVLLFFLIPRKETRCDFFRVLQRWLHLPYAPQPVEGWRAPAVAFEFFFIVWTGHMVMLVGYYSPGFGVHSWLTNAVLIFSIVCTPPLLYLLYRTRNWATAWGRAIPTVLVFWMGLEVLMKWGVLAKPW